MHRVKKALAFRSKSVQEGEILRLSALLNLAIEEVLVSPENEKMETVWTNQVFCSPAVIFWTGPRLKTPGLRWASST